MDLFEVGAFAPVLELLFHFLDGYGLVVLEIEGFEDCAETAIAQGLGDLVLLH